MAERLLYKIKGIMGPAADALYRQYGPDLSRIHQTTIPELKKLKGIGDLSAKCIYAFFHVPAYEFWYNQNVRPQWNRKDGLEIIKEVLGTRIGEIIEANSSFGNIEPIRDLSLEELESLKLEEPEGGKLKKISLREAQKIHNYFHLTGYEFHSRPKAIKRIKSSAKKGIAVRSPEFSDDILNRTLGIILGKEVDCWRKEIEDSSNYRRFIHFERFVLYYNQRQRPEFRPDETTIQLPRIFIDIRNHAYETIDYNNAIENEHYRDKSIEDIVNDPDHNKILKKFRDMQDLFKNTDK